MNGNESVEPAALRKIGYLLAVSAARATALYESELEPLGLRPIEVGVLESLRDEPRTQSQIATALAIFAPKLVPLVNDLERKELAERRPHPTDRRAVLVHLLPDGRHRLAQADEAGARAAAELLAPLDGAARTALAESLTSIAGGGAAWGRS